MARGEKQPETDEAPGAPEWMVTFSDCMTLLLTFFVLLLSFSSFDDRIFRDLKVLYSNALTSITPKIRSDRDAFLYEPPIMHKSEPDKGSEKPTLEQEIKEGAIKESTPIDFYGGIVLTISSDKIFLAKGVLISPEGRNVMDTLGLFLKGVPSRVVISESGPWNDDSGDYFGLPRAWAIMDYLTTTQDIDKKRFSISATGTLNRENAENSRADYEIPKSERTVEIVLLERSIYN
jgi:chemotaxis protein MotB